MLAARTAVRVEAVPVSLTGPVVEQFAVPATRTEDDAAGTGSVAPVRPAEQDEAPQLSDDELVEQVRRWADGEGAMPSRERIRVRFGIGTGRADRVRAAALTGPDRRAGAAAAAGG